MKKLMIFLMMIMFAGVTFSQDRKTTELKASQLPKEATNWISKNISGGKITRCGKVEEKGVVTYVAVVEQKGRKHSYLFDKDGKYTGKGDNAIKANTPKATKAGTSATPANTDPKQPTPPVKTQTTKSAASDEAPVKK